MAPPRREVGGDLRPGLRIDHAPGPARLVQPTVVVAKRLQPAAVRARGRYAELAGACGRPDRDAPRDAERSSCWVRHHGANGAGGFGRAPPIHSSSSSIAAIRWTSMGGIDDREGETQGTFRPEDFQASRPTSRGPRRSSGRTKGPTSASILTCPHCGRATTRVQRLTWTKLGIPARRPLRLPRVRGTIQESAKPFCSRRGVAARAPRKATARSCRAAEAGPRTGPGD